MKEHWADKAEIGSAWGMRFLFEVSRRLGRGPFRIALVPVVLYFFLTRKSKRDASRQYLERLGAFRGSKGKPSCFSVFRHFLVSGEGILERILAWDPKSAPPRIARHGREAVARHLDRGRGVLLIGSHLGNMEVARHLAASERKVPVNVLVHTKHNPRFISLMRRINPDSQASLLQVSEMSPATAMLLKEKVDKGEVVLIAGDRVPLDGKGVVRAPFLAHPAPLPIGPYVLASVLECPVFLFFCLGRGGAYDIHYEPFSERVVLNRNTRREDLAALAGRYAERLSYYCTLAPLLWGNIYRFWGDPEVGKP
ncbi:MAG TPA: acyltransferase [Fibrobacteria bacterium]|nr:acyltransferase [Fibrobacteria bacterium]